METNKDPIYGCDEELKNQTISYINQLCYRLGVKKPPKPFYGGCFYDKDFNKIYIKEVIYNDPAVIVFWSDGTKTTSKRDPLDGWDTEKGLLVCILKKLVNSEFVTRTLEDWGQPALGKNRVTLTDVRAKHRKNS